MAAPLPPIRPNTLITDDIEVRIVDTNEPDIFTNVRPLWGPPGGRGVYGGTIMAQCLSAAQETVSPSLVVSSMHCCFLLGVSTDTPMVYGVERLFDSPNAATRSICAMQNSKTVFTASLAFRKYANQHIRDKRLHFAPAPIVHPPSTEADPDSWDASRPFESREAYTVHPVPADEAVHKRTILQWVRARGRIPTGRQAHLAALAYMYDSFLLGSVSRVHRVPRYTSCAALRRLEELRGRADPDDISTTVYLEGLARKEKMEFRGLPVPGNEEVSMLVTLTHSIYIHAPAAVMAHEWLLSETHSPWSGDGRGLVIQRWWSRTGILIATCVQEGVIRLNQDTNLPETKL
ncbi:hypothetical protein FE257_008605 [Aspergillus nanangensis]|uniref:Acyl-CoA thioesterase II n=1 Tax=Aspergillus nanangensis TaxID=2582783 RepID=A0AAD4CMI9_ASPNN|nr:hypothetical protein FE257_008605 [Aspergillus nanangensis]